MITQYIMTLKEVPEHALYSNSAYRLYAYLLEQLPPDEAEFIHEGQGTQICQNLLWQRDEGNYLWTVNILADEIARLLCPVLDTLKQVSIEKVTFPIIGKTCRKLTVDMLLAHDISANRASLSFCTPTAFKQSGRYTIFPQERLILQSLLLRWNEAFPTCPLEDQDAFEAMLAGIHIVDYQLRTTRFLLKGIRIPGFTGSCVLDARLAPPLLSLWNTLLYFSEFAGIGIKTGIGMGGVQVTYPAKA